MYIESDPEILKKLNTEGLDEGDTIVFCPNLDFQIVNAALKPDCPNCGRRLHIIEYEEPWPE